MQLKKEKKITEVRITFLSQRGHIFTVEKIPFLKWEQNICTVPLVSITN